ncbi:proton myo-inositol cotransporter-like isoform X2 [Mercenaria mercenaria]|uniref:proton myo-inositol cotransporter-like isoform X2 n=1 Tax=Mercenaria mercenaria TaxID=6596 RepID=UPI001E1D86AE|nr:proton myo-inositol cotransporter-like isoform X2 [Mercenaria mercenaria]
MLYSDTDNEDLELNDFEMSDERSLLVQSSSRMGRAQYSSDSEKEGSVHLDTKMDPKERSTPCFVLVLSFFSAIGGFLFGYDTGVVSGAMLLIKDRFQLTSIKEEVIVSVTIGFAFLFALVGGWLNDRFGRKMTTILASIVFTIGAVVLAAAYNFWMLVVGRAILGMGIGMASMTVPVYIAECAPMYLRGRLVTLNTLFITGGQCIASIVDGAFSYDKEHGWRWMLGLAAVPSIIQFIGFIFLPESPRWLVANGKSDKARTVLVNIRGTSDIDDEMKEIEITVEEDRREKELAGSNVFMKILRTPPVRRALIVGCGLQLFQQLSGINTVMYYSATIIKMSGVRSQSDAIWLAAATAGVNFVFTIVALFLVERLGRKKLIMGSLFGVLLSLIVLAVGFQLAAFHSPPITMSEEGDDYCHGYSSCEACIENVDCGFCYNDYGQGVVNGSCLPIDGDDSSHSKVGRCNATTGEEPDLIYAYQYCPTDYSWMGIAGLAIYLMFFAPGMGPMPWTINSEIYPLWARSTCNSLATATNWLSNLVVSMTFLTLTETITKYGTYWLFVGIVVIALVFMAVTLPETRGTKLEEVETLFSQPLCSCSKPSPSHHAEQTQVVD